MVIGGGFINKGFTLAVSGKGGVGKTNLTAMLVKHLSKIGSVLAIDADPDSNLPQALGVNVKRTVGDERESILNMPSRDLGAGGKIQAFEKTLHMTIEETSDFDILVMGRSEGEGCYCSVNHILRQAIDSRASSYDFTLIDCEAGLEHLSRRTTRDVDIMIMVTDPTLNGIMTARRVQELSGELCVSFVDMMVVANRVVAETRPFLDKMAQENGLEIAAYIPYDPMIAQFDVLGKPTIELPEDSAAFVAVAEIRDKILACTTA